MLSRLPSGKHHTSSANIYTTRLYLSLILCPLSRSSSSLPKSARSSMLNGNTNVGARWETKWTRARDHAVRAVGIITRVSFIAKKEEKKTYERKGKSDDQQTSNWRELARAQQEKHHWRSLCLSSIFSRSRENPFIIIPYHPICRAQCPSIAIGKASCCRSFIGEKIRCAFMYRSMLEDCGCNMKSGGEERPSSNGENDSVLFIYIWARCTKVCRGRWRAFASCLIVSTLAASWFSLSLSASQYFTRDLV